MNDSDTAARSAETTERRPGGRHPAGTDPRKRRQILEGASKVFQQVGFDAASMTDVAREAGVSKATLYVYYTSKEQLFAAVIGEQRDRSISEILAKLDDHLPIADVLMSLGAAFLEVVARPRVIQAHRIVIAVVERMPEIGRDMFEAGPSRMARELAIHLDRRVATGELSVPDTRLAATQFLELCQAGIVRPRLYAVVTSPPTDAACRQTVASAVEMFLARYRAPSG